MKEQVQPPTVGRIVHYFASDASPELAAIVQAVYRGSLQADLTVFTQFGPEVFPHVRHKSDGIPGPCWDWMAFQKGQAGKVEELQAELDRKQAALDSQSGRARALQQRANEQQWDNEVSKTQASTPSPVDGKR